MERGQWSQGRPVFKKVNGESRILIVPEESTVWAIQKTAAPSGAHIFGGRGTNLQCLQKLDQLVMECTSGDMRWTVAQKRAPSVSLVYDFFAHMGYDVFY